MGELNFEGLDKLTKDNKNVKKNIGLNFEGLEQFTAVKTNGKTESKQDGGKGFFQKLHESFTDQQRRREEQEAGQLEGYSDIPTKETGLAVISGLVPFVEDVPLFEKSFKEAREKNPQQYSDAKLVSSILLRGGGSVVASKALIKNLSPFIKKAIPFLTKNTKSAQLLKNVGLNVTEGGIANLIYDALESKTPTPESLALFASIDAALGGLGTFGKFVSKARKAESPAAIKKEMDVAIQQLVDGMKFKKAVDSPITGEQLEKLTSKKAFQERLARADSDEEIQALIKDYEGEIVEPEVIETAAKEVAEAPPPTQLSKTQEENFYNLVLKTNGFVGRVEANEIARGIEVEENIARAIVRQVKINTRSKSAVNASIDQAVGALDDMGIPVDRDKVASLVDLAPSKTKLPSTTPAQDSALKDLENGKFGSYDSRTYDALAKKGLIKKEIQGSPTITDLGKEALGIPVPGGVLRKKDIFSKFSRRPEAMSRREFMEEVFDDSDPSAVRDKLFQLDKALNDLEVSKIGSDNVLTAFNYYRRKYRGGLSVPVKLVKLNKNKPTHKAIYKKGKIHEHQIDVSGATSGTEIAALRHEFERALDLERGFKTNPKGWKARGEELDFYNNFTPDIVHRQIVKEALTNGDPVPRSVIVELGLEDLADAPRKVVPKLEAYETVKADDGTKVPIMDGISFHGFQSTHPSQNVPGDRWFNYRDDAVTGSNFSLVEGQDLQTELLKVRKRFGFVEEAVDSQVVKKLKDVPTVEKKVVKEGIQKEQPSEVDKMVRKAKESVLTNLMKLKGITRGDVIDALDPKYGIATFKVHGDDALSLGELDQLIKNAEKIDSAWTPGQKKYAMANGGSLPPSTPNTGALGLAEEVFPPRGLKSSLRALMINYIQTMETTLRKMGGIGTKMAERTLRSYQVAHANTQKDFRKVEAIFNPLTGKEVRRVVLAYENPHLIPTLTDAERAAMDNFNVFTEEYADIAETLLMKTMKADGTKVPFVRRTLYFPHVFGHDFARTKRGTLRLVKKIMKRDNLTQAQAQQKIDDILNFRRTQRREPNIEYERVFDAPGWMGDPTSGLSDKAYKREVINALEKYIASANRRFSEQIWFDEGGKVMFGGDFPTIKELIGTEVNRDNQQLMTAFLNRIRGLDPAAIERPLFQTLKNIQIVRKLGKASIPNSFQTLITTLPRAGQLGFKHMVSVTSKGMADAFKGSGRMHAKDVGAVMEQSLREITGLTGGNLSGRAATFYLKWATPFSFTENMNNIVAANVGLRHTKRTADILAGIEKPFWFKNNMRRNAEIDLINLGVPKKVVSAIKKGNAKALTKEHLEHAAWRYARDTQFRSTPLDLPFMASTDLGKLVYQFKTFSINFGKFGIKYVFKPAYKFVRTGGKEGSIIPLAAFFGSGVIAGEVNADFRALLSDRERPTEWKMRMLENLWYAGTFGFWGDLYSSTMLGKGLETAAGPTIGGTGGEVGEFIRSMPKAIEEDEVVERLGKFAVDQLPNHPIFDAIKKEMK